MSEEFISCDISGYFNHVYHHDLDAWFAAIKPVAEDDSVGFGKYLREINAGRTLDCLPQGIYPTKMIGNDFLRFVEESCTIRAPYILRFMDDIVLLGNKANELLTDFDELQRLLGLKGLTINAKKTRFGGTPITGEVDEHLSEIKKGLLQLRRNIVIQDYDGDNETEIESIPLEDGQLQFILDSLDSGDLGEDDAELIMVVMRDHVSLIEKHLSQFAIGYPHLAKSFLSLCRAAEDKEAIADIVLGVARDGAHVGESQLFWFGSMLEEYLLGTSSAGDIIHALYSHSSATEISKAKILEIDDSRHGLPEMRETFLRAGRSDWLAWASAVGCRGMTKQARNYLLGYFSNGSAMNKLIADIMQK
jgi:Reverse transcriptase (RNA-dependent DNA polymerase)